MSAEKKADVAAAIGAAVAEKDGRKWLTCAQAFEIAKEKDATHAEIGGICDQEGVKIHKCQLGCF